MSELLSIVADIGGTNTRVAWARGHHVLTDGVRRYRNAEAAGIEPILRDFLKDAERRPQAVCIDMAGPVTDGVGRLTNLDWEVSSSRIQKTTDAGFVSVINDLQAQGFAVAHLDHAREQPLLPGRPAAGNAARLVVNVGTGLNAAPVYRFGGQTHVPPSEAGHVALPVQSEEELRLKTWLAEKHGTPGLEDVLSGRGFARLYAWLGEEIGETVPLRDASDVMALVRSGDPRATQAARLFVRFLGRYASDLALITLPFGGIFLVGGVARHFGPHLLQLGFAESFADKGRFASYMTQFPVFLVEDDYAALKGCATHLVERLQG